MTNLENRTGSKYAMKYLPNIDVERPELRTADTRITITTRKRRVTSLRKPAVVQEALDFWSFSGAAANVVMQLGWPEVAYGVMESKVESGALMKHPWKRARTTTQYLAVAILGSEEEKTAFREAVNSAHRHVKSDERSPVKYNAFNRELQLWVAACLFVGIEDSHQLLHGLMDEEEAEGFYQSAKTLGTTLQVPEDMWPATRAEFDHYWNTACQRIVIDDTTCEFLNDLVDLKMINPLIRLPFVNLLRFLTIGSLPPLFHAQLGLEWTDDDRRRFEHLFTFVSIVNKFLPRSIRFGGSRVLMKDLQRRMKHSRDMI
ncbi:oxygenase MpaB family protein [Gordonia alkaliphila]|uniref:Oxygenase MpaB family protein n=1 Tax=Gordonia alkaliphila TaxID=1053547 RepID=A0ABP8ZIA2_9ACTN|nr:oxygenase MpaB family protein [Gordonia alkaliphila]MCK0439786.1 oxygenase MpaB family protein [Gordonia alkaliphila]